MRPIIYNVFPGAPAMATSATVTTPSRRSSPAHLAMGDAVDSFMTNGRFSALLHPRYLGRTLRRRWRPSANSRRVPVCDALSRFFFAGLAMKPSRYAKILSAAAASRPIDDWGARPFP